MGIHMIIHYNCTIGSFLLHSFLLIYHPYPPSFHEMIFTLVDDETVAILQMDSETEEDNEVCYQF